MRHAHITSQHGEPSPAAAQGAWRGLIVAFTCIVLVGCSLKLPVVLFNDAGQTVTTQTKGTNITIAPGRFAEFDYPGGEENWTLHLSAAGCSYSYAVPRTLDHYPWSAGSNNKLKVQVESDFSLYLLPPTAIAVAPVTGLRSLQQDGFPLRPALTFCL